MRVRRTIAFEPDDSANAFKPLVLGKKIFIIEVEGGSGLQPNGRYEKINYHNPYLIKEFGFMSVTDITFIDVANDKYRRQKLAALLGITVKLKETLCLETTTRNF